MTENDPGFKILSIDKKKGYSTLYWLIKAKDLMTGEEYEWCEFISFPQEKDILASLKWKRVGTLKEREFLKLEGKVIGSCDCGCGCK